MPLRRQQTFGVQILRLMSGLSSIGFIVAGVLGTFQPEWVKTMAVVMAFVSMVFTVVVPTRGARRNVVVRSYLVLLMLAVFAIGVSIQPLALGTLSGFVFLGIAVGIASYKETVPALILCALALALGVAAVILRSSQPGAASVVLVVVVVTSLTAVFGFRRVASLVTAEAIAESVRDPLTLTTNRRGMVSGTGLLAGVAQRTGQRMGCAIIDVDHFKAVNDSYGHDAGDAVLVAMARAVESTSRDGDLLVRLGGDEFALFTVVPGSDELAIIAERIRTTIEAMDVLPRITACVGGVVSRADAPWDLDAILRDADTQLYAAKDAGRNAVRVA